MTITGWEPFAHRAAGPAGAGAAAGRPAGPQAPPLAHAPQRRAGRRPAHGERPGRGQLVLRLLPHARRGAGGGPQPRTAERPGPHHRAGARDRGAATGSGQPVRLRRPRRVRLRPARPGSPRPSRPCRSSCSCTGCPATRPAGSRPARRRPPPTRTPASTTAAPRSSSCRTSSAGSTTTPSASTAGAATSRRTWPSTCPPRSCPRFGTAARRRRLGGRRLLARRHVLAHARAAPPGPLPHRSGTTAACSAPRTGDDNDIGTTVADLFAGDEQAFQHQPRALLSRCRYDGTAAGSKWAPRTR